LREIAIQHLTEGFETGMGFVPPNSSFVYGSELLNYAKGRRGLFNDALKYQTVTLMPLTESHRQN